MVEHVPSGEVRIGPPSICVDGGPQGHPVKDDGLQGVPVSFVARALHQKYLLFG